MLSPAAAIKQEPVEADDDDASLIFVTAPCLEEVDFDDVRGEPNDDVLHAIDHDDDEAVCFCALIFLSLSIVLLFY